MTELLNMLSSFTAGSKTDTSMISFTNGLFIVALLLVIYLCLSSTKKRKVSFAKFCESCQFLGKTLLSNEDTCSEKCKYNPKHQDTATKSMYQKK